MYFEGSFQAPVRYVRSLILTQNHASRIAKPGPFRLRFEQPMKLWGLGRAATQPPSGSPNTGAISTLQVSILQTYATWRVADIEEQTLASSTFVQRIYIFPALQAVTHFVGQFSRPSVARLSFSVGGYAAFHMRETSVLLYTPLRSVAILRGRPGLGCQTRHEAISQSNLPGRRRSHTSVENVL